MSVPIEDKENVISQFLSGERTTNIKVTRGPHANGMTCYSLSDVETVIREHIRKLEHKPVLDAVDLITKYGEPYTLNFSDGDIVSISTQEGITTDFTDVEWKDVVEEYYDMFNPLVNLLVALVTVDSSDYTNAQNYLRDIGALPHE